MKPTKAYIIRTPNKLSMDYSNDAAEQCKKIGVDFEFLDWFHHEPEKGWNKLKEAGVNIRTSKGKPGAQCCWSAHIYLWKRIIDTNEAAIILEHDGMMLHKIDIDIPDNMIVVLGYKVTDWTKYDAVSAGPPIEIVDVCGSGHEGSHAYTITPTTAKSLLKEIADGNMNSAIDNHYFLRSRAGKTKIPIKIMSPTPAIGWVRQSTIQPRASEKNYPFIKSFEQYYKK